jgi:ferredoxin
MYNAYLTNTLKLEAEKCTGCGICLDVCPHGVFAPAGRIVTLANPQACMECGACQVNCAFDAITVESGVGCAWAMTRAALSGKREVVCG